MKDSFIRGKENYKENCTQRIKVCKILQEGVRKLTRKGKGVKIYMLDIK